jgi:hypothetical protein
MANAPPPTSRPRRVQAAPKLSRTLGILVILYSLGLLGYGAVNILAVAFLPMINDLVTQGQNEILDSQIAKRKQALEQLETRAAEAKTPAEKAKVTVDRLALERTQPMGMPTMGMGMGLLNDPKVRRELTIDTVIKLVLNTLMLIAGIGLMRMKDWGRKLGLFVSWAKVPALIVLTVFTILSMVPALAHSFSDDMGKLMSSSIGKSEIPPDLSAQWAQYDGMMNRSFSVLVGIFGAFGLLFPALMIVMLNGARVRAELAAKSAKNAVQGALE